MKVSCLLWLFMAIPAPRAVLNRSKFVPMLLKTAYPAAFWMACFDVGCSLFNSSRVCAAILRDFSLFFSLSSPAFAAIAANSPTMRIGTTTLGLMTLFLRYSVRDSLTLCAYDSFFWQYRGLMDTLHC